MRAVAIAVPVKKPLLEWDAAGDVSVWIKPVRQLESGRRSQIANRVYWEPDENGIERRVYEGPGEDRKVTECFLTFHDADIQEEVYVDEHDSSKGTKLVQMFQKGMAEKDFRKAFARLEDALSDEWYEKVLEVNPQWDEFAEQHISKA